MNHSAAQDGQSSAMVPPLGSPGGRALGRRPARRPARWRGRLGQVALVCAAALSVPIAAAEVVLGEQVQKVETLLDASGNVERRLTPADAVEPGDELRYTITVSNNSGVLVTAGRVVVTNPVPEGTVYVPGSAGGAETVIEFSGDGETFVEREADLSGPGAAEQPPAVRAIRWSLQRDLQPGARHDLFFHVRMAATPSS